jgi:hypothetical protein
VLSPATYADWMIKIICTERLPEKFLSWRLRVEEKNTAMVHKAANLYQDDKSKQKLYYLPAHLIIHTMMKIYFLIVFFSLFITPVKSQSCDDLPANFRTYSEAIRAIQNTSFTFTDELPFGKSSWILGADYYSCDGYFGYMVYTTDKRREFILEKVPLKVWAEFKEAKTTAVYYMQNIKGKYRLVPE